MVAIISMAALSIDVATLYVNRAEAQRAADAAALAGARVISLSGITTNAGNDATSWQNVCGPSGTATLVAQAVAAQNGIGGTTANTVSVTYSAQGSLTSFSTDCSSILSQSFAINPTVIVQVQRTGLPTFFSRIRPHNPNSVSATAAAEIFNPSGSDTISPSGDVVPVTPHCVKPMIIPNIDPAGGGTLVSTANGAITNTNIVTGGVATPGIGESITLTDSCSSGTCSSAPSTGGAYVPANIFSSTPAAVPSCATDTFQNVVAGCDDNNTEYVCGTRYGAQADPSLDRGSDISTAIKCVTNIPTGNDTLDVSSYPFKIIAGSANPILHSLSGTQAITSSNSVISVPIYDQTDTSHYPSVTIVGFMQMFVTGVDTGGTGNIHGYLLNVAGCGNDASTTLSAPGTSPVPIRLITP